ncbi:helix-turn-helix domain-containing protein [Caenispirillum salinarum]|uniref:AlbA family DNA-binding domain-containing protein n=1 Tax=Caenispirillum salinarum TaxID=859058 RepID=UPI00384DFAFE
MAGRKRDGLPAWKIPLIKAMLRRGGWSNEQIAFLLSTVDDTVNLGRVSDVKRGKRGGDVEAAIDEELDRFLMLRETNAGGVDPKQVYGPVHPETLRRLFVPRSENRNFLALGESDWAEAKERFNTRAKKYLKPIMAFANNRGGYLLFGVVDGTFEIKGIDREAFERHDIRLIDNAIGGALSVSVRIEKGGFEIDGKFVGLIYVHEAEEKPVFTVIQDGTEFADAAILYRYPGQNLPIRSQDLRRILAQRERQAELRYRDLIRRVADVGATQAAVVDLDSGRVDRSDRSHYFLSPETLKDVRLVDEGHFTEREGAPALTIVGTAEVAGDHIAIKEHLGPDDLIEAFLDRQQVPNPAAYLEELCHASAKWLPVYFFAQQAGFDEPGLIAHLESVRTRRETSKNKQLTRLRNRERPGLRNTTNLSAVEGNAGALAEPPTEEVLQDPEQVKIILRTIMALIELPENRDQVFAWLRAVWERPDLVKNSYIGQLFRAALVHVDELGWGFATAAPAPAPSRPASTPAEAS